MDLAEFDFPQLFKMGERLLLLLSFWAETFTVRNTTRPRFYSTGDSPLKLLSSEDGNVTGCAYYTLGISNKGRYSSIADLFLVDCGVGDSWCLDWSFILLKSFMV